LPLVLSDAISIFPVKVTQKTGLTIQIRINICFLSSTSIKYSDQSKHKGTRMMLVSNVALGNCKDYTNFQKDLQGPAEGYDSCHGVASVDENYSEFKVF
jgi:hypothetical protein